MSEFYNCFLEVSDGKTIGIRKSRGPAGDLVGPFSSIRPMRISDLIDTRFADLEDLLQPGQEMSVRARTITSRTAVSIKDVNLIDSNDFDLPSESKAVKLLNKFKLPARIPGAAAGVVKSAPIIRKKHKLGAIVPVDIFPIGTEHLNNMLAALRVDGKEVVFVKKSGKDVFVKSLFSVLGDELPDAVSVLVAAQRSASVESQAAFLTIVMICALVEIKKSDLSDEVIQFMTSCSYVCKLLGAEDSAKYTGDEEQYALSALYCLTRQVNCPTDFAGLAKVTAAIIDEHPNRPACSPGKE